MPPPPPPPQFAAIPTTLQPDYEKHDRLAVGKMAMLANHYPHHSQHRYRGWGSWGFAVLRIVYTPESDILFPLAMERLREVVRWWCHYTRFPSFGASCKAWKVDDGSWNEEVFGRFWLDVVEDREGLGGLDATNSGSGGKSERFGKLAGYFRRWCEGVDTLSDTGDVRDRDPRFTSCLVVDGESLAALAQMEEEVPLLQCAMTREEKAYSLGTGYPGWLWLVEARYMALPAERRKERWGGGGSDTYPGWLRVQPCDLFSAWANHWNLNDGDRALCLGHAEVPEGVYVYKRD